MSLPIKKFFPHLQSEFNDLFKSIERLGSLEAFEVLDALDRDLSLNAFNDSYPPSNIIKVSDSEWKIELALAGFKRDQINVEQNGNTVTVKGSSEAKATEGHVYMKRGIGARNFILAFKLPSDSEVAGSFEDGILTLTVTRELPPEVQPKKIALK